MIHVSLPDTKTVLSGGSRYEVFNVHLNGSYHASVRYSHFLRLYETLKREFGERLRCEFPPKKLRHNLSSKQLEERKIALHHYLQAVAQDPVISNSSAVAEFFLDAQIESFNPSTNNISIEICLPDGFKQTVRCSVRSSTSAVLQIFCQLVDVSPGHVESFGLFLVRKGEGKTFSYVRWLKEFESPYVSLQLLNQCSGQVHRIIVRKCIWDLSIELELADDIGAAKLFYAQAVYEVNANLLPVNADVLQRLRALQHEKSVREYVKLCQVQKQYGFMHFDSCLSDFPRPETRVDVKVGNRQIVLAYPNPANGDPAESVFRVTRVRGWKLVSQERPGLLFTFEYLLARDHFEWITLYSQQSVLLSLCLQAMGSEILKGSNHQANSLPVKNGGTAEHFRYESFTDMLSTAAASLSKSKATAASSPVPNEAFNTITDDDL